MQMHLDEISRHVAPKAHGVVLMVLHDNLIELIGSCQNAAPGT